MLDSRQFLQKNTLRSRLSACRAWKCALWPAAVLALLAFGAADLGAQVLPGVSSPATQAAAMQRAAGTPAQTLADPAAQTPADPAAQTPADPAVQTPADPAAQTPADPAAPRPLSEPPPAAPAPAPAAAKPGPAPELDRLLGPPTRLRIAILNASGNPGQGDQIAILLDRYQRVRLERKMGLKLEVANISIATPPTLRHSVVYYRTGHLRAALLIARALPGSQRVEPMKPSSAHRTVVDVEIWMGKDMLQ